MNIRINKDIKSYIHDLTELVWAYIRHRASYPANALLAVQRELACNVFDSPDNTSTLPRCCSPVTPKAPQCPTAVSSRA